MGQRLLSRSLLYAVDISKLHLLHTSGSPPPGESYLISGLWPNFLQSHQLILSQKDPFISISFLQMFARQRLTPNSTNTLRVSRQR